MTTFFAQISPVWVVVAAVIFIAAISATVAIGRGVTQKARAEGGSAGTRSGSHLLKITLILALGLGAMFVALFVMTSNR